MAAIPRENPSLEKTKRKSQSLSVPCRYPIPGHVGALTRSTPTQPLSFPWEPGGGPACLPHHAVPSSYCSLPCRGGGWEGGIGLLLPSALCSSRVRICPSSPATSLGQSQRARCWILP